MYNDAGELTEETDPMGNITRYTYSALGLIESVTDGMGRTVRYVYLPGGRLEKIIYPNGCSQRFTYDRTGRIKTRTDIYGNCLTYHYDCMGRVVRMTGEAGQEKSFVYGSSGKPVSMKDVTGNITTYEYSPNGNMTAVTDAAGNRSEYAYDEEDHLIRVCRYGTEEETPRETIYERDSLGQIESIRDASGRAEHYSFDALGRISEKTDGRGIRTAYFHTPDGKRKRIEYGDGTWSETDYTTSGKPVLIKNPEGEIRIERDRSGRPVKITDATGKSIFYEWGNHGERKSMVYPDGEKISYRYDENLKLKELIRKAPGRKEVRVLYKRNKEGKLTEKIMGDGLRTVWEYNHLGQLSRLVHENHGRILDEYRYEYDAAGNRTALVKKRSGLPDESGAYSFEYDRLYRLIRVKKDGNVLRTYQYDSFGNRTVLEDDQTGVKICSVYNAQNQMVSAELRPEKKAGGSEEPTAVIRSFDYDENGNLTAEYEDGRLCHGYRYNAMNRLAESWNGTGERSVYHYNGLGRRDGQDHAEYTLDLTRPFHDLLEIRTPGGTQKFYRDHALSFMEEDHKPERYYMNDELGSPVRVLYETGRGEAFGYDEFGNDLSGLERQSVSSGYTPHGKGQPFGYIGYLCDPVSNTLYAHARQYQPWSGRFIAQDKIPGSLAEPETLNRYAYCWNDPVNFVDPDGMKGYYFYDPDMFKGTSLEEDFEELVESDIADLERYYKTEIEKIEIESASQFEAAWEGMNDSGNKDTTFDVVVIFTHANNDFLQMTTGDTKIFKDEAYMRRGDIQALVEKKVDTLILLGCNVGLSHSENHTKCADVGENYNYSLAETFYTKNNAETIGRIIASDGSTTHRYKDEIHMIKSIGTGMYHGSVWDYELDRIYQHFFKEHWLTEDNDGFLIYTNQNGNMQNKVVGKKFEGLYNLLVSCDAKMVSTEKE